MLKASVSQIIQKIKKEESFTCILPDSSVSITIEEYVPYICTAIHSGGNLRKELRGKCLLSKAQRWSEEDPHTDEFISSLPIRIVAHDSRYEYDLNRPAENCVYDTAWGQKVWRRPLSKKEQGSSIKKHHNYYKILSALVTKIEEKFNACLVFDIHSYNGRRLAPNNSPLFNLGTKNIKKKYRLFLDHWLQKLSSIDLPFIDNQTAENAVFQGNGHQLKYITKNFNATLVLATEIKKCYVDEESGDIFPEVITALKEEFKRVITSQAKFFANKLTNVTVKKRHGMLGAKLNPIIGYIDTEIYKLLHTFDVLNFVTPSNLDVEKRKFLRGKAKNAPEFKYRPLKINSSLLKRELYSLPIREIQDVTLQNLYSQVIDSYADQVDLLSNREDIKFLYSSLKYYGEPSANDIAISNFLLSAPLDRDEDTENFVSSERIHELAVAMIQKCKFKGTVREAKNIAATAIFNPEKNELRIRSNAIVTESYAQALAHHEIGVHMLTSENAQLQPLKILKLGFPLDTKTQEGLAILSEYLSGNLSIYRLKELAFRVMAVEHMIKNYNFIDTFNFLRQKYQVDEGHAFNITARVYRGGGFTKDFLYLSGFKEIYQLYNRDFDAVKSLMVGKTSLEFLPVISELLSRNLINRPKFIPLSFKGRRKKNSMALEYILRSFL